MRRTLFIAALAGLAGAQLHAAATVDFVKDIEPIFQKSCISCHGPDKQKGELRLDTKAAAFKGGKDGQILTVGKADKSDLYRRIILPAGSDDVMPSKGDLLTKAQTDLVRDWINQGAVWPDSAVAKAVAETPGPASAFAGLTPFKPSSAETGAIAKLATSGIDVRLVAANATWREANLRTLGTNATDTTIAPLKDIASLVDLNLGGTKVTDAGLQNIGNLTNLISLHLEHTAITDAGLAHLKKLSHLAYLNLYGTAVTDAGVEQLKSLSGLHHLYLWQTKVTAAGATSLKKALPAVEISRGWENEPPPPAAVEMKAPEIKKDADKKEAAKTEAKK
jgi:mono/diheme cytochrome c family protein